MTSVIHVIIIIITIIISLAGGSSPVQCVPSCTCRQKYPKSFLAMDCSGVINFPITDLNIVNSSASVSDLDLSNNSLTSLPTSSFRSFVRLETLTLRWNRLAVVDSGAFDGSQLRRLDLSGNQLATVRPRTFSGVESTIVELDLSSNVIVSIDDAFVGLSSLSRLDLRHNLLASLTSRSLRGLSSLRHLRLDHNLIAELDELSLTYLSKLTNFALRGNPLSALMRLHFPGDVSLSYIDLSECSLMAVPRGVPDTVTYVQLRRNNITRLNGDSFFGASRIKILVLDENQISEVTDRAFRHLINLKQLWLNNNRLDRVPGGLPSSVQRLMLDSNYIDKLSSNSFPNLSQLNTLTLMGNAVTDIEIGAFHSLFALTHLDLSANKIASLVSGLFETTAQMTTLLLSRNPVRSLNAGSFHGITELRTLSLSFVQTRICVDEDAFMPLTQLTSFQLDNSPWLAARFVSSSRLVSALTSLTHLSLQRTDLAHLETSFFPTFFPNAESVRLSGSGWVCDEDLMWLRDWLITSSIASDLDHQANRCAEPPPLARRLVVSLVDHEFQQPPPDRPPSHRRTKVRTGNSKILRDNADAGCNERSRTTSSVAMVTRPVTPTNALSSLSGLLRGRKTTSLTSQLRHGDVTDAGLVQVILIVCTLIVTLVLSVVIISVIVRLASRHRRDNDDVISGLKSPPGHVTGSRVSVRHCPPVDTAAEGWRSRASSLSRSSRGGGGGSVADYQRQAGGKKPVYECDGVNDRLVNNVDVERVFTNGGGTRLTDEQWRVYTWEDT